MKRKIILYALALMVVAFVAMFIYRFVFEFNNAKVKAYLQQESKAYKENAANVYALLHEAAQDILKSSNKTAMARQYAKATGMEKERVLVDMAVAEAKKYTFID